MGGFSRLKRQPSLHGLSSRMSSFMSQDLDLPWTLSTKDNNNSLQYPTKSSRAPSTVLGKSSKSKSNKSKSKGRLPLFKSNKKISIITNRGVSPTITVNSETSSSSSSSSSSEEGEREGFEVDVNILPSDDTVYNNLDNSDYINNTSNNSARSGELSSAHSGSLTTFANNCSPPILIPTNFDIEMDIVKSNNGGDGIIESLSSLDKSSKSRSSSKRASSPKSVRSRLTVTPIVEFCTDNNETVLGSVKKEDLSPIIKEMNNLESDVVMESTSNNNNDIKEKMCHILVDELGSSIETLRSGGSVLSTNTSGSSNSSSEQPSSEQPKMFILPDELNGIETLRSGSASEKIFILPQEEGSRLSLDHQVEEKSSTSSSSGRSTPQEEQGLQLDIDKLQAYETIMKHLTAYEMSELPVVKATTTSSPLVGVQKSKYQREKKRSLIERVGNHLDKKTYQGIMKRSRRRRSRRLRKKNYED